MDCQPQDTEYGRLSADPTSARLKEVVRGEPRPLVVPRRPSEHEGMFCPYSDQLGQHPVYFNNDLGFPHKGAGVGADRQFSAAKDTLEALRFEQPASVGKKHLFGQANVLHVGSHLVRPDSALLPAKRAVKTHHQFWHLM